MTTQLIDLNKIKIDGNTQVRFQMNPDTVCDYADAGARGEVLPPIKVFQLPGDDGYVLADGFHRYHAALSKEATQVRAEVLIGDAKDALRFALGANKVNGLPMSKKDKEKAIRLALENFPEDSDNLIGKLIGVDHKTVAKHREAIESGKKSAAGEKGGEAKAKKQELGIPNSENTPETPIKAPDSPKSQPSTPPAEPAPKVAVDEAGIPIPEHLLKRWETREIYTRLMTAVSKLASEIAHAAGATAEDHWMPTAFGFEHFEMNLVKEVDLRNVRTALGNARPAYVCPQCKGKGCALCGKTGFVNKGQWTAQCSKESKEVMK